MVMRNKHFIPWFCLFFVDIPWSKEVWKSGFRQYGEMERQRWEESETRSQEVSRSEKRKSEKQEEAGARKGRKVAIHCVFPMIWGSGGSKSNLAKAAGAEPSGDERWKSARRCGAKHISKSKLSKTHNLRPLLEVESARRCGAKHVSKSNPCVSGTLNPEIWGPPLLGPTFHQILWDRPCHSSWSGGFIFRSETLHGTAQRFSGRWAMSWMVWFEGMLCHKSHRFHVVVWSVLRISNSCFWLEAASSLTLGLTGKEPTPRPPRPPRPPPHLTETEYLEPRSNARNTVRPFRLTTSRIVQTIAQALCGHGADPRPQAQAAQMCKFSSTKSSMMYINI